MGPTPIVISALTDSALSRWIDVTHAFVCLIIAVSIAVHRCQVKAGGSHPVMVALGAALRPRRFEAPDVGISIVDRKDYRCELVCDLAGVPDGVAARTIFDSLCGSWGQFYKYRHVLQHWTHQLALASIPALSLSAIYLGLAEYGIVDFSGPRPWPVLIGWSELHATTDLWGLHHMIWVLTMACLFAVVALLLWRRIHQGLLRGVVKTILIPTGITAALGFANVSVVVAIVVINIVIWLALIALAGFILAGFINTAGSRRSRAA